MPVPQQAKPQFVPPAFDRGVTGFAPAISLGGGISEFVKDEKFGVIVQGRDILSVRPSSFLTRRKVYAYSFIAASNVGVPARCNAFIRFYLSGSVVGELPFTTWLIEGGAHNNLGESDFSCVNSGGNVVQDSITIIVASPLLNEPDAVIMQPQNLTGSVDEIRMYLNACTNVSQLRLVLACISAQ